MKSSWKSLSLVLSATVALSIALNLLQAKRILDLEEGPGAPPSSVLRTGSQAPDLHAKDLLGNDFVLSFHSKLPKPVVLYVFSQSCHWCQRNSPSINSLVAQVGSKYRFIGLSLSDTGVGPFLKQHQHVFPAYQNLSTDTISAYGLGATPTTIVLSTNGTILANWPGAYSGVTKSQIEKFFGIHLRNWDLNLLSYGAADPPHLCRRSRRVRRFGLLVLPHCSFG